uniref:Translocation and assembly module TamB C-terminal domain-containing protein n=1 Tax=candidate division WOR-3 bacterium TaxID=2052148 RepID=A0A7V0Z410_UNCW3
MKKLIITTIVISIIIISLIVVINVVNWGVVGVKILNRLSDYKMSYEKIEGNLFKGYTIQNYIIKISATDSIYGGKAQISYRFLPLSFRLPTIFELNLLNPVIYVKEKKGGTTEGRVGIPKFNLSLRINIKNGRIIYENSKKYEIQNISGLIFIDFLGKSIYLTTMNLSLKSSDLPIQIYSANLSLNITPEKFDFRSYQIKGKGINLQGNGFYIPQGRNLFLRIKSGRLELNEIGLYKGVVDLRGEVHSINGKILLQTQGTVSGIDFIERVSFESNIIGDTTIINFFDGNALDGNFSAQVKMVSIKDYVIETNFRNIDIAKFFKSKKAILLSGRLGYKDQKFFGVVNSPIENGFAIDTLYVSGHHKNNQIFIDTFSVNERDMNISAKGKLYPDYEIGISIYLLDLKRFNNFYPVNGFVYGNINLKGRANELAKTIFNADLKIDDFNTGDFYVNSCLLKLEEFVWSDKISKLIINVDSAGYKNFYVDKIAFNLSREKFSINAFHNNDTLFSGGKLYANGKGTIDSFMIVYHKKNTYNIEPISFDIFNKKLSPVHLKLANGSLYISPIENKISISDIDLEDFSKFLGLKEQIKGRLGFNLEKNLLSLDADNIFYRGLNNGKLIIRGEYQKDKIKITRLDINDDKNLTLNAYGIFSLNDSKFNVKFKDVRPWIFPFLNSFMENPDGLMSGELEFEGNLKDFKITGETEINNASFGINIIAAKFDSGYANVKFTGNQIIFETIKAQVYSGSPLRSGIRNWASGGGIVKLEPKFRVRDLRFDFSFRDAPVQYQNYAYGIGSGNFSISMKDEVMFYNGNINIKEGVIPIAFGTYLESGAEEEKKEWRMNLKLSADRNIWLRNRDADIEFGGEVYIIKEQTPLYILGSLETKRGNYYWLNHILKITSGKITFIPQEVIDPELDFWAEMDTRERDPETNQEIKIILHCTGNISEPIFEFFSEPPKYSEQDILTYMNLNITWRELESMKQGEYVGTVLPRSVLAWLESDVSRRLRAYTGLDYFRVEAPIFEPQEKTKVTVGKYISRNLFITYTYDITSFSNEFNVEYFINDRNEILIKRDETGEYSLQYQYRIRF